jgi:nucleoside triphosphatase
LTIYNGTPLSLVSDGDRPALQQAQGEQAVIRESKEETGLDVYDVVFINFQEFIYDPAFWKPRHFIFFDFACKTDGAEVCLNDEAQGYIWVEPRQSLSLALDTYTRRSIETYLKRFSQV